jgi:hypothetical protein
MAFGDRQEALAGALQTSATELSRLGRQVGFGLVGFALAMLVSDSSFAGRLPYCSTTCNISAGIFPHTPY